MKHPPQDQLALFAGGEAGWFESWSVRRHLVACPICRKRAADFSQDRQTVRNLSVELPPEVEWNRLADEMAGNIRVGLAAGEAIAAFDRPSDDRTSGVAGARTSWLRWNAGWAIAAASAVFAAAFWLNLPNPQAEHLLTALRAIRVDRAGKLVQPAAPAADEVVVEASGSSIQVRENGGSLALLHPRSDGLTISVNMQGSAGARYIDSDTGQVTINRVYYAQQ